MSDQWAPAPAPKRPRRWLRRLPWFLGSFLFVLLLAYFFVTSHTFLESFVLPKVAEALGTSVSVGGSSISPFRKVTLREVKVGGGAFEEPLLSAREVRARYSLWDIVGGHINVDEIVVDSPIVQIVQLEDGTSNLDPLLKKPDKAPPETSGSSGPVQLQLGRFLLTNAVVRQTKHLPGGGREITELADVTISAANLRNAQVGALKLGAGIRFERTRGQNTNIAPELIQAKLAGEFEIGLTADLQPESIRGQTTLDLLTPPSAAGDIKGSAAVLECDLTPTELRQLTLTFKQAGNTLGQITARGPFDLQRREGQINVEINSVGRHALNMAAAASGLDFGSTSLNSTQQITIANAGKRISAVGGLAANKLSIARSGQTTHPLDLDLQYDVTVDEKSALIQRLTIAGAQNGTPIIRGNVTNPLKVDLSGGTNLFDPSSFDLQVTNFNLADWRAFIGDMAGTVSLGLNVNAGKQIAIQLDSRVANLGARFGSNQLKQANVALSLRAAVDDMKAFRLDDFLVRIGSQSQTAMTLTASGKGDIKQQNAEVALKVDADLARVTNFVALSGIPAGHLKLATQIQQRGQRFEVTNFVAEFQQAVLNLVGSYDLAATNGAAVLRLRTPDVFALAPAGGAARKPLSADIALDAGLANNLATIRDFSGKLGREGGAFVVRGQFNVAEQTGNMSLTLNNLNEGALGPIVDPALGKGRTLKSCSINVKADAQYSGKAGSLLNTELQLARLLINDPEKQLPSVPLGTTVKMAGSLRDDEVTVKDFSADLATGESVGGQIRASGKYHLKTGAGEGTLRIVDLTEKFLAPFAAVTLSNKQLASVAINVDMAGRYDPARDVSLKGELNVSNFLVRDDSGKLPQTPLALGLEVNTVMAGKSLNLETCRLRLAPTSRARNELSLSGKLDLARTNVFGGDLHLFAEALDLTPYYDLFAGNVATNTTAPTSASATTAPAAAPRTTALPQEPEAIQLPVDKFSFGINIGQLYLREISIQNWQTAIAITNSQVRVDPIELALNGAPIKGAVAANVGMPGYQYELSLNGNRIPMAPFADSFSPAQRGKVKGDLIFASRIKGAGVTGRSLQKSLAGNVSFSLTNAQCQLSGRVMKTFFTTIGLFIGVPDLASSPISWLGAEARVGSGTIELAQCNVVSETFTADTQGNIKIADILANSPLEKLPMHLWLRRSLAQRLGKIPRNTPPDANYVKMPDFIRVAGTVSEPKPELNRGALAGAIAEKFLDSALKDKTGGLNPLNALGK
jgi:hypothetical protein